MLQLQAIVYYSELIFHIQSTLSALKEYSVYSLQFTVYRQQAALLTVYLISAKSAISNQQVSNQQSAISKEKARK
jgi:hypothetical protein